MKHVLTVVIALALLSPNSPSHAQDRDLSQVMDEASQNIERYRKGDATISFHAKAGEPIGDAEVTIQQTSQDFLFGNIIFPVVGVLGKFEDIDVYRPELFKRRFKGLFNMAIFPFYWSSYEPIPGKTDWNKLTPILEWCKLNGVTPKGHPLAWVERGGTPRWLYDLPAQRTEELLLSRITRIAKGFKGDIDTWDVVNEPTHTVTWNTMMKDPLAMRYTAIPIKDIADWVEPCFRRAHEANPEATLVLNDYEQISSTFILDTKERFYALAEELLKRGTPVHGLGLQAHEPRSEWYSPELVWDTLNYYAKLGLPLHITEFVAESSGEEITGGWKEGKWTPENQAEYAEQVYRLCFGHPLVESLNWWGLSDRYIWNERPAGGLLDEEYRPKPVYTKLQNLIKDEWMTKSSDRTNSDGFIRFRGYYGKYKITVTTGEGRVQVFNVHLKSEEANEWEFSVN